MTTRLIDRGWKDAAGVRIHGGTGDPRLELCLDLARRKPGTRPLPTELADLARTLGAISRCEVCSIYVREGEDVVMRANVGFQREGHVRSAVGHVRMRVGEGLTGLAVECMSPVTASLRADHRSKPFPGLGEDEFPVFLAMPLVHGDHALGALVLQRREGAFSADELRLYALAGGIVVRHLASKVASGAAMRLAGRPASAGVALGRVMETSFGPGEARGRRAELTAADLRRALAEHASRCGRVQARILRAGVAGPARVAEALVLATLDAHFPSEVTALVDAGKRVEDALASVSAEAARGRAAEGDPFLFARARDVEALGRILLASARSEKARLTAGAIVVAERLAAPEALLCVEAGVAGVALAAPAEQSSGLIVLEAVGIPAVAGIDGLFPRARDGSRAIVDGDHGVLILDPTRSDLSVVRRHRKRKGPKATAPPRLVDEPSGGLRLAR
jgi:phosphotransferase system enzyme I (PtsP)